MSPCTHGAPIARDAHGTEVCLGCGEYLHESDQSRYASECDLCETDGHLHLYDCPNNPRRSSEACRCPMVKIGGKPTGSRNWNPDCPVHPWTDAMQAQADRAVEMQRRAREARKAARK
jgi:hypothetical protein